MATTYATSYRPTRRRHASVPSLVSNTSLTHRYNDPDANYDDPAYPKPVFVSRLQPVSFSSSMAPERVAYSPVPLAYPENITGTTLKASSLATQSVSSHFSTTSLAMRKSDGSRSSTLMDHPRMGMTGPAAFQFSLRAETGSFTNRPKRETTHVNIPHSHTAPSVTYRKPRMTDPRVSARLPPSAFYYHVNHTNSMLRENRRQAAMKSPNNPRIVITQNVHPRAPTLKNTNAYGPPNAPMTLANTTLFPVAYNPGFTASTARPHAFDLSGKTAPLGPPEYDSFPLHPNQTEYRTFGTNDEFVEMDQITGKYQDKVIKQQQPTMNGSLTKLGSHTLLQAIA